MHKKEYHEKFSQYPESGLRARQTGSLFYFTGKRCKNNHLSLRYASSGNCQKCIEEKRGVVFKTRNRKNEIDHQRSQDALKKGHVTYLSFSHCKKGHNERYALSNNCVKCAEEVNQKRKISGRWKRIKKIYGLTKEDYEKILLGQNYKCGICEKDISKKNHIDHCHETNIVRGILCSKCNQGIGLFDENVEKIKKAINYIERHYETKKLPKKSD